MQGAVPDYYSAANYFGWWGEASWEVLLLNALWLAMMTAHLPAEGVGRSLPWPALFVGGVLIWLAVVRGRQHGRLLSQTLVGYGILILFWPWPPARFLIPLLPFLVLYAVEMVVEFSKLLPRRVGTAATGTALIVVLTTNLWRQAEEVRRLRLTGYPHLTFVAGDHVEWSDYNRLFDWLRTNTDANDVLGSGLDSMLYMYTDRKSLRPFVARPTALIYGRTGPALGGGPEFIARLSNERIDYIVHLPMPGFAELQPLTELIDTTLASHPGCLREVHRLETDRRFVVYRTDRPSCRS
jgi:hypothetical protein